MRYIDLGCFMDPDGAPSNIIVPSADLFPGDHRYLVSFLNADFTMLESLVAKYIADVEMNGPCAVPDEIYKRAAGIHPWFLKNPANVSVLLNRAFAAYASLQCSSFARRESLFCSLYASLGMGPCRAVYWLEEDPGQYHIGEGEPVLTDVIGKAQNNLKKLAVFLIDSSTDSLSCLSPYKRISLYGLLENGSDTGYTADGFICAARTSHAFGHVQGVIEASIKSKLDFSDEGSQISHENILAEAQSLLLDPGANAQSILKVAAMLDDKIKETTDEIYSPSSIFSLLSFEIWEMFRNGETLKRDSSGKFVEPEADRAIAEGPKELYTRAYKTHHARIRYGMMTKEQFSEWAKRAKEMRIKAEKGDISLEEFASFLKK